MTELYIAVRDGYLTTPEYLHFLRDTIFHDFIQTLLEVEYDKEDPFYMLPFFNLSIVDNSIWFSNQFEIYLEQYEHLLLQHQKIFGKQVQEQFLLQNANALVDNGVANQSQF